MTPEEFANRMKEIAAFNDRDPESTHIDADGVMCAALRELGYGAGVEIFEHMKVWYA